MQVPIPTVNQAYAMIINVESQRMNGNSTDILSETTLMSIECRLAPLLILGDTITMVMLQDQVEVLLVVVTRTGTTMLMGETVIVM